MKVGSDYQIEKGRALKVLIFMCLTHHNMMQLTWKNEYRVGLENPI